MGRERENGVRPWGLLAAAAAGAAVWFLPAPPGLAVAAWRLFAFFLFAILAVVLRGLPILTASLLAGAGAVLSGTLPAKGLFAGFSEDFILLIVAAFLLSRAVILSGLGARIAYHVIRRIGGSPRGLLTSLFLTDALIAPAFPSNTARSGVLYPVAASLCEGLGADPAGPRRRLGAYLMVGSMASLSLSSALWLTAMAANPAGAGLALQAGVKVTFASWFAAAVVPVAACLVLLPWVLLRAVRPEVERTPEAPALAAEALGRMGPPSRKEWITAAVFASLVAAWALGGLLPLDRTAAALLALAVLMAAGVLRVEDFRKEGEALEIWLWFALLFTLSSELNRQGFMAWLGGFFAGALKGSHPVVAYLALVAGYVLLHYFFVSQSAHLFALYGVFLEVAVAAGVNPALAAYMLLFATNFFSCITPQGSSANVLFAGSGHLTTAEIYRFGGLATAVNTGVFLLVGTPWILWAVSGFRG